MRVLVVCSGNSGQAAPFIQEQAEHLARAGCIIDIFLIRGKGWLGYLRNRRALLNKIKEFRPDVVHAHSGMSALLAGLQKRAPVVATFHGSDVNVPRLRRFTRMAMLLTNSHIVVSNDLKRILGNRNIRVIPCAVDDSVFHEMPFEQCRSMLGWLPDNQYVLFASSFQNAIKNPALALAAIESLNNPNVHLIELKDRSRLEVAQMLNACDAALLTSFSEGSPQFIKEAMACGTPVVSTRVGDVAELLDGLPGYFLVHSDVLDVASNLQLAMKFRKEHGHTTAKEILIKRAILPAQVTSQLMNVYAGVLKTR
ncbi:MAG: glycosyltransferase [Flavobacteriales bacterium]